MKKILIGIVCGFVLVYVGFKLIKDSSHSLFFTKKDRITVVLYGKEPFLYSIGLSDGIDYAVPYSPDLKILVPGGYKEYRVGALGKLNALEHKPDIYKRAFGLHTGSFVDFYFYSPSTEVFYGKTSSDRVPMLNWVNLLFFPSNASLADRIYLLSVFSKKSSHDFRLLSAEGDFATRFQGFFYQNRYRLENKSVQILYTSYQAAETVNTILEGSGIRVGDMTETDVHEPCTVRESSTPFSQTASAISSYFNCRLTTGKTDIYDILFELGDKEKEWE
ncbi:hypothetical protein HGA88_02095 [Candidatus Roizmanbacteria bacterium]|nr:hypothetical protein [Candidatus Roizmanbacteria bacterium]